MIYEFKIKVNLEEIHLNLIKELAKNSNYVSNLEMKGFHFTSINDLCCEGIACRNDNVMYVWLTALGKQIAEQLKEK